jgi:hypothetical protein
VDEPRIAVDDAGNAVATWTASGEPVPGGITGKALVAANAVGDAVTSGASRRQQRADARRRAGNLAKTSLRLTPCLPTAATSEERRRESVAPRQQHGMAREDSKASAQCGRETWTSRR